MERTTFPRYIIRLVHATRVLCGEDMPKIKPVDVEPRRKSNGVVFVTLTLKDAIYIYIYGKSPVRLERRYLEIAKLRYSGIRRKTATKFIEAHQ